MIKLGDIVVVTSKLYPVTGLGSIGVVTSINELGSAYVEFKKLRPTAHFNQPEPGNYSVGLRDLSLVTKLHKLLYGIED